MRPNQSLKLLQNKENHPESEKTIYGMGENICK